MEHRSHASRSAGKWKYTNAAGSAPSIAFTGTRVDIMGSTAPNYGKAIVTIDGTTQYWADFYTSGYLHNRKVLAVTGLASGPHTVAIEWTGDKNTAPSGTGIGLDAVDIDGTLVAGGAAGIPGRSYEETEPEIVWTGTWVPSGQPRVRRAAGRTRTAVTTATFTFTGTRVEYCVSQGAELRHCTLTHRRRIPRWTSTPRIHPQRPWLDLGQDRRRASHPEDRVDRHEERSVDRHRHRNGCGGIQGVMQ